MVGLVKLGYSNILYNMEKEGVHFYYDLNEGGDTFYRAGIVESG